MKNKEVDPHKVVSETICTSGDLNGENIKGDALDVEVFDQVLAISKSIIGLDQTLEANEEDE